MYMNNGYGYLSNLDIKKEELKFLLEQKKIQKRKNR